MDEHISVLLDYIVVDVPYEEGKHRTRLTGNLHFLTRQ
jgi:hypothetical protein